MSLQSSSTEHPICIQRDNWGHYGLQKSGYFDEYLRPELALFKTEHHSRLKTLERMHQCRICFTVWKTDDDHSEPDILEQGCLLSEQECDKYACNALEDVTHLPDNAFTVKTISDDISYSNLERNPSNNLNISTKERVASGLLSLDLCCYVDPSDNCEMNPQKSNNSDSLFQPKCITNLDISNIEESNLKIFNFVNLNSRLDQSPVLHYVLSIIAFLIIMVVSILFIVRYFKLRQMIMEDNKQTDLETATGIYIDAKIGQELAPTVSFTPDKHAAPSSVAIPNDLSELRISTLVEEGLFGYSIFQGTLGSKPVMVKSYPLSQKQSYFNEREVYELMNQRGQKEFVKHFLGYHGSGETLTSNDGATLTNFVVLESSDNGNLSEFLDRETISWSELCQMLSTISQGLSYLHGFNRNTEPNLCHRNINGHNVLVKRDMSCCLCNFDHVVVTNSSGQPSLLASYSSRNGYLINEASENTENITSEVVGLPRYLAPEVLDNALDIHPGEISLKQTDVYAMGLVFWEISRRCRDLYQGVSVPSYEMAFYQELGTQRDNPSLEQMQILVSRYKARPLFPAIWKNSNPAIQRLRETIEDSWDQDGEARLTAFCIVERVQELNILWERYKKTSTLHGHCGSTNRTNILPNNQSTQLISNGDDNTTKSEMIPSVMTRPHNFHNNRLNVDGKKNSVELGKNNSLKAVIGIKIVKNNNLLSRQQPIAQIQPHQGHNPCMERNIVSESQQSQKGEELCPLLLVYGSVKDAPIQTGPLTDAYDRFDYDEGPDDSTLSQPFPMGRQRQTTPQPIQLNVQNDFGGHHETLLNDCHQTETSRNQARISILNSLWKKKRNRIPEEPVHTPISKRKPDINQEWEKEYIAAAQMIREEELEVDDEQE